MSGRGPVPGRGGAARRVYALRRCHSAALRIPPGYIPQATMCQGQMPMRKDEIETLIASLNARKPARLGIRGLRVGEW